MAVSEWCSEKTGWLRMGPRRRSASGRAEVPPAPPPPAAPKASRTAATCARVVVSLHEMPTRSPSTRRRRSPRPPASTTIPAARPGSPDDDSVEELLVVEGEAGTAQRRGQPDGPFVDPAGDAAQSLGTVVHRIHGRDDRQQDLCRTDVRGRPHAADALASARSAAPAGRPAGAPHRSTTRPGGRAGPARDRPSPP